MTLYIGNISKNVEREVFVPLVKEWGKCSIDFRNKFAYVTYIKDRDA